MEALFGGTSRDDGDYERWASANTGSVFRPRFEGTAASKSRKQGSVSKIVISGCIRRSPPNVVVDQFYGEPILKGHRLR